MAERGLLLYLGVYPDAAGAEADYEDLKVLHHSGRMGTYDAAVISKDAEGKVHIKKREKPTQHATWTGVGVGAVLGVLFPPSIIGTAVVTGAAGGLIGHLWKGMSRADVKELGEALDAGEAALLVVASPDAEWQAERILSRSRERVVKQLDVDHHQFAEALAEAEKQHAGS
jgi:uncharacterized membrane protein